MSKLREILQFSSIRKSLLFWFLVISLIPMILSIGIIYRQRVSSLKNMAEDKLVAIRDLKVNQINEWIDGLNLDVKNLSSVLSLVSVHNAQDIGSEKVSIANLLNDRDYIRQILKNYIESSVDTEEVSIVNPVTKKIEVSTNRQLEGKYRYMPLYFNRQDKTSDICINDIHICSNSPQPAMSIAIPIFIAEKGQRKEIAVLATKINLSKSLYKVLLQKPGMNNTGETLIVNSDSIALNELRWKKDAPLKLKIVAEPAVKASNGMTGIIETLDYRDEMVLAAYTYLPKLTWGFIAKQDLSEIYMPIDVMVRQMVILIVFLTFFIFIVAMLVSSNFIKPIIKMVKTSEKLQADDLSARNNDDRRDELGLLANSFDDMADNLSSRIKVQANITELIHSTIKPKETEDFALTLLNSVMETTNSCLGAFYIRTDENLFVPIVSIGLDEAKKNTFNADLMEGQFGISLATTSITRFDKIPEDTVFTSKTFLGDILPKDILTLPFDFDGKVEAILTIASVGRYSEEDLEVLEFCLNPLKVAFSNVRYNEETGMLSRKLKVKNAELMEQARTLREHAEELEVQKVEIESQRDHVEEANRFKSSFLSNMSHELRTPLNSILAISRIMSMKSSARLTIEDKKYLEIVERNGKQLLLLINDILELSKIEANRVEVSIKSFDLSKTIEGIVETITPLADDKKISVQVDICEDFPLIENDEEKIRQIIVNLLGNAIKFTEKGSIEVTCRVNGGMAVLEVKDTGIGISAENKSRIFDEFRQIDGTTSRKYGGTGLGLAIVKKLLHLLGGNVTLESTLGEGSTFTVLLPVKWGGSARVVPSLEDISFDKEKESNDERAFDDNSVKDQKLILVVEDNKIAALQVKLLLEEEGYLVDIARNGEEAMKYVQHEIPDGLVLDLMMPGVDGFEVLENIRSTEETATIPVIILTAKDLTQEDLNKLSANNVQQLVQKGDINREGLIEKARLAFNKNV